MGGFGSDVPASATSSRAGATTSAARGSTAGSSGCGMPRPEPLAPLVCDGLLLEVGAEVRTEGLLQVSLPTIYEVWARYVVLITL